ncbi:MAG: PEP-CTERM sorting domain-containing protein [Planctomycetales bacterium]|nr:PEP-CTERM sorting domain-containing protein [Planctomycetales bacterium]
MATAGLLVWSAGAHAAVISFNIDIAGTIGGDGNVNASGQSPADALAGVVSVGNWTGTWNGSFQNFGPTDLIDSDGNATTMDISSLAAFDFNIAGGHPGQDADGTWNKELINGYMNSGASSNPSVSMFTLSEIPYAVYDIIAYFSSDAEGRSGAVTDGATTYDFSTLGGPSVGGADAVLTQTTSTGGSNPPANYAIFRGLSGASQTITASIPDFGGLAGIQVVQVVPEPAALSLAALGMACAVRRRRR